MSIVKEIARKILPRKIINAGKLAKQKINDVAFECKRPELRVDIAELKKIVIYSIGARAGLPSLTNYLRRRGIIHAIGFEPDIVEAERLRDINAYDYVSPYALGSKNGSAILNVTQEPGCSSMLLPHKTNIKKFCNFPEWFNITKELSVDLHRLDEIVADEKLPYPNLLQIDVQGFEFEVLSGATEVIDSISVIELEVVFYPVYIGQKTFEDIHKFMSDRGFILFQLEKQGAFGHNCIEANAAYYNEELLNTKPVITSFLINYCNELCH